MTLSQVKDNTIILHTPLELEVKVKAHVAPYEPQTWNYPGSPAQVEDYQLFYKGVEITGDLLDRIIEEHGGGIEDDLLEEADRASRDMHQAHADHLKDIKEDR